MQKFILILTLAALSACSTLQFPGVYKIAIEQGNVVNQEMIDQLKPGMSKDQVEYIMGSPLVKDTFNVDRWDYVYYIKRGNDTREQYRMAIFFKDGNLNYFTGDFLPSATDQQAATDADDDSES
ncbi:outer membrane protein assembly factor BamE [Oceanicoccus sp. KOV_DT_Chl]|uniref:outer membrane protein assembly factor BamE n=1 Tax=Oceanicoccus sp. KOV_DT_Chl TaxID=1904639 RepID=UPI000C7D9F34|nr:outer membrane protein assembly factor BamE [Oceanicoccus sp. KOV_DT_Chl]